MGWFVDRLRRLKAKIVSEPLSAERIAAGWALGMFVGCAVPFGFQLVVSVPLALRFRVSKIGATVGTLVTNPITILFIYPAQTCLMYCLIYGDWIWDRLPQSADEWTWARVRDLGFGGALSFFLGGLVLAAILTPITYYAVRGVVVGYRRRVGAGKKILPQLRRHAAK